MAEYIALKRLTVNELNPDGTNKIGSDGRPVTRTCVPGDPCPEASAWRNVDKYIRTGAVGLKGLGPTGPALADSVRRNRPASKPDRAAGRRRRVAKPDATASETRVAAPIVEDSAPRSVSADESGDNALG